jgi:hypothetical protein
MHTQHVHLTAPLQPAARRPHARTHTRSRSVAMQRAAAADSEGRTCPVRWLHRRPAGRSVGRQGPARHRCLSGRLACACSSAGPGVSSSHDQRCRTGPGPGAPVSRLLRREVCGRSGPTARADRYSLALCVLLCVVVVVCLGTIFQVRPPQEDDAGRTVTDRQFRAGLAACFFYLLSRWLVR